MSRELLNRRSFFTHVMLASAGTAVAALAVKSVTDRQVQPSGSVQPAKLAGYQETEHIRSYYRSAQV